MDLGKANDTSATKHFTRSLCIQAHTQLGEEITQ